VASRKNKTVRIGLETSAESLQESEQLAARLCDRILELARRAGLRGITANEAEREIDDHKMTSVSPRFSELVKQRKLVRLFLGYRRHGSHSSKRYFSRFDEDTRRKVTVYWASEFAVSAVEALSFANGSSRETA
jgi:hypothetical protein